MSTAKHTGGNWQCKKGVGQMVHGGTTVAEIGCTDTQASWWIFTDADQHGDPEADACLIAAAPELLDALVGMLEVYGVTKGAMRQRKDPIHGLIYEPENESLIELSDQARAAIAKAIGVSA